ncbi:hypothetical protein [Chitinophaga agri]|uniref:Uncharacterized protein n=1 Tax=Chitinophaga agri TaxID=2703787 RepID=A0A6B9ZML5_9BACT|nr:hypothetical protein [Chitinophaga agri]QHS63488.1 hypothetical protein GWR21_29055 [Chitinophaga agri]
MRLQLDYSAKEKIRSLSSRLNYISKTENDYLSHVNAKIKSENLQYNLSLIIAHIILQLSFTDRSKATFKKIINEYNGLHQTKLCIDDFERIHWIRNVHDELVMPLLVGHYIWQVGYYQEQGKATDIPVGKEHLVGCLQLYSKRCFDGKHPTISRKKLQPLMKKYAHKKVTENFLLERGILHLDTDQETFIYKGNDYLRYLRHEVSATLWLLICEKQTTIKEFKRFVKLANGIDLYHYHVADYLDNDQRRMFAWLAYTYLQSEPDLLKTDFEFEKIWLDAESHMHISIGREIPRIEFNYQSVFHFIQSVEHTKLGLQIFDYQRTRIYYSQLLKILIENPSPGDEPYKAVNKILKDLTRPFLLWILYHEIPEKYPEVIPYLLNDTELIPLAFRLVDRLPVNDELLKISENPDRRREKQLEITNDLFLQSYSLVLDLCVSSGTDLTANATALMRVIMDTAKKVFRYHSNDQYVSHYAYKKRYDELLRLLRLKKYDYVHLQSASQIAPRLVIRLLPGMAGYLLEDYDPVTIRSSENISLDSAYLDVSVEVLRLSNMNFIEGEASGREKADIHSSASGLLLQLRDCLLDYFHLREVEMMNHFSSKIEQKLVRRGLNTFGLEIIDWGYLYLCFARENLLSDYYQAILDSVDFNTEEAEYDDLNSHQADKLRVLVKSLLLAYISISEKRMEYELEHLPVKDSLNQLEGWISELAIKHSVDQLQNERINIFDEKVSLSGNDPHYLSPRSLLFSFINYLPIQSGSELIKNFFADSIDIGSMLNAINIFESKVHKDLVSERIKNVNMDEYINSRFTVTDLKDTLIQAANSDAHRQLAKPLMEKIQAHFKKRDPHNQYTKYLLFNVDLILALEEKDAHKLAAIEIPVKPYSGGKKDHSLRNLKTFFIALHKLYNEKKYDVAIKSLQSLLSNDEHNVRYAYHLFRGQVLKASQDKNDTDLLIAAQHRWDTFLNDLPDDRKNELTKLKQPIAKNQLYYYVAVKDDVKFDQTINLLSKPFLYDQEILMMVYENYNRREMFDTAHSYMRSAVNFLENNGHELTKEIRMLKDSSVSQSVLGKYRNNLGEIRNLPARLIPHVTPEVINDRRMLNEFVLNEIIQASKVLCDKIHGVKTIEHEDRFSDLLLAILKLRFQIWGWSITDQARKGNSATGKNAGETDITIESGGTTFALIEALNLETKNIRTTQSHMIKIFDYAKNLERYYMIIYYIGKQQNIDAIWSKYQQDIKKTKLKFPMDKARGFEDLTSHYEDVNHLRIARTCHDKQVEVFHMLIDLSDS